MDLNRAYAECARITRREARNFYFAFLSLPRRQRRAVYALYAFCREADDVADAVPPAGTLTEKHGEAALLLRDASSAHVKAEHDEQHSDPRREGLRRLRERLLAAGEGRPQTLRDAALADAIDRFGVRLEDLDDVIAGVEMDLEPVRLQTDDELEDYCYHVASAVGLATLPILNEGIPPTDEMRDLAIRLGLGMQFVNVLRDVAEDLECGRVYLPASGFARHGLRQEVLAERSVGSELRELLCEHAERARSNLAAGAELARRVPRSGRSCLWLLAEIYGRVLDRIEASGYDVFAGRVSLPNREKLGLLLQALGGIR
jgi:phytoene synthase